MTQKELDLAWFAEMHYMLVESFSFLAFDPFSGAAIGFAGWSIEAPKSPRIVSSRYFGTPFGVFSSTWMFKRILASA